MWRSPGWKSEPAILTGQRLGSGMSRGRLTYSLDRNLPSKSSQYGTRWPTVDLALPVALKCHRSLTLSDQDLVARVLTIVVLVGPVAPVIPIIWRELFGDVGHGDQ